MTRFARAKGSKASNERVPEEATSWAEMKQQLITKNKEIEGNKKRQEILNQRNANYKAFLEERQESESKKTTWVDFPESIEYKTKSVKKIKKGAEKLDQQNNKNNINYGGSSEDKEFTQLRTKVDDVLKNMSKSNNNSNSPSKEDTAEETISNAVKQKQSKQGKEKSKGGHLTVKSKQVQKKSTLSNTDILSSNNKIDSDSDAPPEEHNAKEEVAKPVIRIKKPKQKKIKIVIDRNFNSKEAENNEKINKSKKRKLSGLKSEANVKKKFKKDSSEDKDGSSEAKNEKDKVKLDKVNQKKKIKENLTEEDLIKIEKKKQRRLKQLLKKKQIKAELKRQKEETKEQQESTSDVIKRNEISNKNSKQESFGNSGAYMRDVSKKGINKDVKFNKKTKKDKLNNNEEHFRKKPFSPHKMFINGKELEIEYVDGFPIKKEDAERIKKLRREMISKGLPRSEINIALKLERRKAEKALAREKKKVCFNCRKSGHNLSECPDLNKDQVAQTAGSGICFKCGSTEHTHFECKVIRGEQFKFAQCFICHEQGHIARQCPDNARGLYPKGGACKVCGDVTHLKKDCPTYQAQQQKQEDGLKLETFGDSNPDVLEQTTEDSNKKVVRKKPNKIIKF